MIDPIPVKIIEMRYSEEEKVFFMKIMHKEKNEEITLVIKSSDFGIPENVSKEIIDNFCKEMEGKEKELHVRIDDGGYVKDYFKNASEEQIDYQHDVLDKYPYREMIWNQFKKDL
jgi:hypothetical protein